MTVQDFLVRLEGVKPNGSGWQAICPAHEDKDPSLSISEGNDGTILVKCHAGCDTKAVLTRMDLDLRDLFPAKEARRIVATYDYTDEAGQLLYQVVRYDPKDFRQRRPGGPGEEKWVWNLRGVRRVLYNLPSVLLERDSVYIVEGEKDVDAFQGGPVTATCNVGGAGKWRDDYTKMLAHVAEVVVVADRDEPGRKHAAQVLDSLTRHGITARVMQPPEGCKDVSDMRAKGLTRIDLEPVSLTSQALDEEADDVATRVVLLSASVLEPEHVEWVDEGLIPLRSVTTVTGVDGVGKSTILYEKAAQLTRGTLPGAFYGRPVDVVIASSEDHPQSVIIPRLIAAGADLERVRIVKVTRDGFTGEINFPDDLPALHDAVEGQNVRLLIVDPLAAHLPADVNAHRQQDVRRVMAPLVRFAEESGVAVVTVIHFNGAASNDVRTRMSMNKAFRDTSRSVLVCGVDPEDETRFVMVQDKNSHGPKAPTGKAYQIDGAVIDHNGDKFLTSKVHWLGDVEITSRALLAGAKDDEETTGQELAADVILDALQTGPMSWDDLWRVCKAAGVESERTARRGRDKLNGKGLIDKIGGGGAPWLWNLATPYLAKAGGQVEKPALTRGNAPPSEEVGHIYHSGQVPPSDRAACAECGEVMRVLLTGQLHHPTCCPTGCTCLEANQTDPEDDPFVCAICGAPAGHYTLDGEPRCDPHKNTNNEKEDDPE